MKKKNHIINYGIHNYIFILKTVGLNESIVTVFIRPTYFFCDFIFNIIILCLVLLNKHQQMRSVRVVLYNSIKFFFGFSLLYVSAKTRKLTKAKNIKSNKTLLDYIPAKLLKTQFSGK